MPGLGGFGVGFFFLSLKLSTTHIWGSIYYVRNRDVGRKSRRVAIFRGATDTTNLDPSKFTESSSEFLGRVMGPLAGVVSGGGAQKKLFAS